MLQVVNTYNTEEVPEDSSVPILKKGEQTDPTTSPRLKKQKYSSRTREFKWHEMNDEQYFTKNAACPVCILYMPLYLRKWSNRKKVWVKLVTLVSRCSYKQEIVIGKICF